MIPLRYSDAKLRLEWAPNKGWKLARAVACGKSEGKHNKAKFAQQRDVNLGGAEHEVHTMTIVARIAGTLLKIAGWRIEGALPSNKKFIVIVAPHTSNWDFFLGLSLGLYWDAMRKTVWFGKHTLFVGFVGRFLRRLGGIPINRSRPHRVVPETLKAINKRDEMILALAPEGTRRWTDHWKSGFYLIALKSGLPVALAFIDYRGKRIGVGPLVKFTGDQQEDWALLANFYQKEWAKYPEDFSDIRPKRGGDRSRRK